MNSEISRRTFVGATAAGVVTLAASRRAMAAAGAAIALPGYSRAKVLRVFIGMHPAWPNPALDMDAEAKTLRAAIDKVPGAGEVEFVGDVLVRDNATLKKLMGQHKDAVGILAVPVAMGTGAMLNLMADSGVPTISFAAPYSGHEWCIIPDLQRQGKKIDVIPTSEFNDVEAALRQFRALHRLRETRVLYVGGGMKPPPAYVEETKNKLGVQIIECDHAKLVEAYEAMDAASVQAETQRWTTQAEKIVEPSAEEISKSSRLSLALQKVLADHGAQAITINCLGLFGMKGLPAYPCFGFVRLNDMGLAGVCEADLPSTLTQLIFQHMTGKPGFVTDPVFDTSRNAVIHAHCVAATKMDGPQGESAPYIIRSHLEDNKGAVLQTKMRVGQEITMAKLVGRDPQVVPATALAASPADCYGLSTMLISTGKIIEVPDVDRGCRTKIMVEVRDARKMLEGWSYGLHRVIFYGDHVADAKRFAQLTGMKVVEEC